MATFGERVRQARERAGLSQAQLADLLRVKQQAVAYLENPKKNAQASRHTSEIARACGVDAGWLAREDGPAPGRTTREPHAASRTAGQKRARSDAEKLLALVQCFLNTDSRGRDALYGQALAVNAADNETSASSRTDRRARGHRG